MSNNSRTPPVKRKLVSNLNINNTPPKKESKTSSYKIINTPFHMNRRIKTPGQEIMLGHYNRTPSPTNMATEQIGFLSPRKRHVIPARTNASHTRILEGPYHVFGRNITNPESSDYVREDCYKEKYRHEIDNPDRALVCLATMLESLRGRIEVDIRRNRVVRGHFNYLDNLYRDCLDLQKRLKDVYMRKLYNTVDSIQKDWERYFDEDIRRIHDKIVNYG